MSTRQKHNRLDRVEAQTGTDEDESPWIVFGPQWAEKEGVPDPPDEMEAPVYSEEQGWLEKDDALPGAFIWVRGPQESNQRNTGQ